MKCHIVQDLLPLYAEHLTSAQTEEAIRTHLEHCEACAAQYRQAEQISVEKMPIPETIAPLKKIQRRSRKTALLAAAAAIAVMCMFHLFCVHGIQLRSDQIHMEISTRWQYTEDRHHLLRRFDTLAEAEADMAENGGSDLQEYVSIRYSGDCLVWRMSGFNTFYERQTDAPERHNAEIFVHEFYATLLPNSLHRSQWASNTIGSALTDGSTVTIRCKDGDFTYDLSELCRLAHESPDGIGRLTVGDKLAT